MSKDKKPLDFKKEFKELEKDPEYQLELLKLEIGELQHEVQELKDKNKRLSDIGQQAIDQGRAETAKIEPLMAQVAELIKYKAAWEQLYTDLVETNDFDALYFMDLMNKHINKPKEPTNAVRTT